MVVLYFKLTNAFQRGPRGMGPRAYLNTYHRIVAPQVLNLIHMEPSMNDPHCIVSDDAYASE